MNQSARDDPKLREVKAVLHHLQGLPSADLPPAEPEAPLRGRRVGMAGILIAVVAAVAIAGIAAVPSLRQQVISTFSGTAAREASGKATSREAPDRLNSTSVAKANAASDAQKKAAHASRQGLSAKQAVDSAVTLMNGGQVEAARKRLHAFAGDGSPDVLWALARSYDPTVLAGIVAADAAPDAGEAERWYRAWHAAAVQQGLVNDSGASVEKIVRSMHGR
jgi:hypothetical protein